MKSLFGNRSSKTKDAGKDYPPPPPPPPPPRGRSPSPPRRSRQEQSIPREDKDPNRRNSRSRAGPTSSASRAQQQPSESSNAQPESSHMPSRNGMYNERAAPQQQSPTDSSLSRQSSMGSDNMYRRGQSPPRQQQHQHPAYEGPLTPPPEVPKRIRGQSPPRQQFYSITDGPLPELEWGAPPPRQQNMQYPGPLPEQTPPPENSIPSRQQYMPTSAPAPGPTPPHENSKRMRGQSPPRQQVYQPPPPSPPRQQMYPPPPPPPPQTQSPDRQRGQSPPRRKQGQWGVISSALRGEYESGRGQQTQEPERSRGPSPPPQQYQYPVPGASPKEVVPERQGRSPPSHPIEPPRQAYGPENVQRSRGQSPPRQQMIQLTNAIAVQSPAGNKPKRTNTGDFTPIEPSTQLSQDIGAGHPAPAGPVQRNDDNDKVNRAVNEAVEPLMDRVLELQELLRLMQEKGNQNTSEIDKLQAEIEEGKTSKAELNQECESIKQKFESMTKERDNLKRLVGAMGEAYKGKGLKYEDTLKIGELKEQVATLERFEEHAKEQIAVLTAENDALKLHNTDLEQAVGELHSHLEDKTHEHEEVVSRLEKRYRVKTKELKDEYTQTKAGLERDLQSTIKRLRNQHQEEMLQVHEYFTNEAHAREQQLADVKAEMAALKAQMLRDKRAEAENLEKTMADAYKLQEEMLRTITGNNSAMQRVLDADLARRRSEIQRLESTTSPSPVNSQRRESSQSPTQHSVQSDERRRERRPTPQESSNGARKRSSTNASTYSQEAHHSPNMNGPVVAERQGTPAPDNRNQQSRSPTTNKAEPKAVNSNKLTKGGAKRSSSYDALRQPTPASVPAAQFHRQTSSPLSATRGSIASPVYTIQAQQYNGDPRWEVPSLV